MTKGPKEKRERFLGVNLGVKATRSQSPKGALSRRPYKPGVHGPKKQRRSNMSDFGKQIREKQKFKISYGVNENNLKALYQEASKDKKDSAAKLIQLLERRLDNVVFRLGIAGSRAMGRQLVVQGHIFVNGTRTISPAFSVRTNDVISIRPESFTKNIFKDTKEAIKTVDVPTWMILDKDKLEGKIISMPKDVEMPFAISLLVESFSK